MNDTQLQIIISLVNEAAGQLAEVGTQLSELGTQAADASEEISGSLSAAELAAADAAIAAASQWEESTDDISAAVETVSEGVQSSFASISDAALAAANSMSEGWQSSIAELQETMKSADSEIVDAATTAGEEAGTAAGEGFGGYFKKMIVGYGLEQLGSFLSGGLESAIAATSKSGDQITQLTTQIQQQKADIQTNEAALQKWYGTTQAVNAAHEKAAANIAAEKEKITELTQQLAPLQEAQHGLTGEMQSVVGGILQWIEAHKQLETELETFMTTLGPILQYLGEALIVITLLQVALSVLDGPLLMLIAVGVAVALLTAIWETFHNQIVAFFDDLNAKTGIITFLQQAWDQVVQEFENKLLPALKNLWTALQPLMPFLGALAVVIGATLIGALVLLVDTLTTGVTWFVNMLTAATNLATFFTNVLVGAINKVEDSLNAVFNSAAFKAVSGLVGAAVNSGNSILNSVSAAIPKFANGGIVSSPTLALVGEAGPEAIIPLSAFSGGGSLGGAGGIGGGAGSINVYIQGGSYLDQGGAQQIASALATQIGRQLKLRNFF